MKKVKSHIQISGQGWLELKRWFMSLQRYTKYGHVTKETHWGQNYGQSRLISYHR